MPKVSKETASTVANVGPMENHSEQLGDFVVAFSTSSRSGRRDSALQGTPDDRCQAGHWGYVFKGKVTFKFADHEEVYEAGDAYYAPPRGTFRSSRPEPRVSSSAPRPSTSRRSKRSSGTSQLCPPADVRAR